MATLILTAVGSAVGGPVGGMIGALVGQQIDAQIFKPKGRQGPRLGDLSVQTSSYGTAIPKLFGIMRVAGTVVWATDLQEHEDTSGGGKGQPKTTLYSYSASFAVAISARPVRDVKRIWADGKLLRGAAGDFKSETGYRLYRGGEDQPPDPLIAAAEGATPAYRGIAYALFEDFQLEDYGNRIPSLTFEVEADAGPVAIGSIAEALSGGEVRDAGTPEVAGYAASGDSVRAAIEALGDVAALSLGDDGDRLSITSAPTPALYIEAAEAGATGAKGGGGKTELARRAAGAIPGEVSVAYHDPGRDYQTGLQRATRGLGGAPDAGAGRAERIALPAVLQAGAAKAIAERRLAQIWTGRASAKLHLGWRRCGVRPGARVRIEGEAGHWRVQRWTLQEMVLTLELVRVRSGRETETSGATPGRPVGHPDRVHGPTSVKLLDLPLMVGAAGERPLLLVAAAGAEPGWRGAAVTASFDGGASWEGVGRTAAPALMGQALSALGGAGSALIDTRGSVEVELMNSNMWLEGRSDAAIVGGANLALLGAELIQFGEAVPIGPRRFRLSRLVRGRRGTEWASSLHQVGEDFLLIERAALLALDPPVSAIGGEAWVSAKGLGDAAPAEATCPIRGEALRPPSPVHLGAALQASGDLRVTWVRRSRSGWAWLDGGETPLGEERELYRLRLSVPGFERTVEVGEPAYVYAAPQRIADGVAGAVTFSVSQVGTYAASRPAALVVEF